jgi:hypothetical protein
MQLSPRSGLGFGSSGILRFPGGILDKRLLAAFFIFDGLPPPFFICLLNLLYYSFSPEASESGKNAPAAGEKLPYR